MDKLAELVALGSRRKKHTYDGYQNVADFHGGRYESDFVSPYTKSAPNVDSPLAFVLQDWYGAERLQEPFYPPTAQYGHNPNLTTNINLKRLLRETFGRQLAEVFATNLFPFIKPGKMNARIPRRDYDRAFQEFCWPQIRIVDPKAVVCLGAAVYNTFARGLRFPPSRGVGDSFVAEGRVIWHQYHPAAHYGPVVVNATWAEMRQALGTDYGGSSTSG